MSRPKQKSYFPQTEFPMGLELSKRDEAGRLASKHAADIADRLQSGCFKVAKQMPVKQLFPLQFTDPMIDQILDCIEDAMDRARAIDARQASGDLERSANGLIKAAADFEKAIAAYAQDGVEQLDIHKLSRLGCTLGYDEAELRRFRRNLKMMVRNGPESLVGQPTKITPNGLRSRFGRVLLSVYQSAGGVITKTKSQDGMARNHAAMFLIDVGKCLQGAEFVSDDILFLSNATAERFVSSQADSVNSKGT